MSNSNSIKTIIFKELMLHEKERNTILRKIKNHNVLLWLGFILAMGTFFALIYNNTGADFIIGLIVNGIAALSFLVLFVFLVKHAADKKKPESIEQFEDRMKIAVFEKVVKRLTAKIHYAPKEKIDRAHVQNTFLQKPLAAPTNSYTGGHLCTGTLHNGRSFQFSEINISELLPQENTLEKPSLDSDKTFQGLFILLENSVPIPQFSGQLALTPKELVFKEEQELSLTKEIKRSLKKPKTQLYDNTILDADFSTYLSDSLALSPQEVFKQSYTIQGKGDQEPTLSPKIYNITFLNTALGAPIHLLFNDKNTYALVEQTFNVQDFYTQDSMYTPYVVERLAKQFKAFFALLDLLAENTYNAD